MSQKIPAAYILTLDKGMPPTSDKFSSEADKARARGWPVFQLESDHNPHWSAPGALVDMLKKIGDTY